MNPSLLTLVQQQFDLQIEHTPLPLVQPQSPPLPAPYESRLQQRLDWGRDMVTPTSNERTRSECVVAQTLLGLLPDLKFSLFSGSPFEVDAASGLVGTPDYLISLAPLVPHSPVHPPVVLIVEVKRELERCLSHCLLELVAAQRFNGTETPVYGVLTTGLQWQWLQLEGRVVTVEQTVYDLKPVETIGAKLEATLRQAMVHHKPGEKPC